MPVTQSEMNYARSWIGDVDSEDDLTFSERFERYFDQYDDQERALNLAIEESMRAQLTIMSRSPASVTLPGGISASFGQNMTTMMASINSFIKSPRYRSSITLSIRRLTRPSTR